MMWNRRLLLNVGAEKPPVAGYIKFADKEIEKICIANYSSDKIGVTFDDAENVKLIDRNIFENNTIITTFNELVNFKNVITIQSYAFKGTSSLNEIILPESLQIIGSETFYNCTGVKYLPKSIKKLSDKCVKGTSIQSVDLPNLESLGGGSFHSCGNLKRVENLGKIKQIYKKYGDFAYADFAYCEILTFIKLPSTLEKIDAGAFYGCSSIQTIVCDAVNPPTLGDNFFSRVIESIYVPDASVDAYKAAPNWSAYASKIKPLSTYVPR